MKQNVVFFLLTLHLLYSCEYNNDPVYLSEVTPLQEDFKVDIDLSHVNPNSIIYIYEYTKLGFKIDTKGHEVLTQKIWIEGVDAEIDENNIYLVPLNDNSIRKLVFDIELTTNTGSIAEIMGYEKYVGKYEYNVKFVKLEEDFDINFRGGKSEEGYLQLNWDEPKFDNATLQKYEITFFDMVTLEQETHIITDPKQTSFIDKNYVWGHVTYQISAYYKNNDIDYTGVKSSYFTPEYYKFDGKTKFNYQFLDNEWMNVSWEHTGYKCKYLIVDATGLKIECDENNRSVKIQRFRFPFDNDRFKLYILPYNLPYEEYEKSVFVDGDVLWNDGRYEPTVFPQGWNVAQNEYYSLYQGEMKVVSISDFKIKREYFLRELVSADITNMAVSSKTSQIAIYKYIRPAPVSSNENYIYNSNFENPIKLENPYQYPGKICLTDNYRLYYKGYVPINNEADTYFYVCDSRTGEVVAERQMMRYDAQMTVSSDGKYLCEFYENNIKIHKLENDIITPIYSFTNSQYHYSACQISYTNPNELILSGGNETIVFDMNTLETKYKIKGLFIYQDPVSGNFGCLDENYDKNFILNIYDDKLSRILTKIPFYFNGDKFHVFLNNRLIYYYTGSLNISDYIN